MRIVVMGAGIIGLSCAYELAKDGHEVVVLESGTPAKGAGASSAAKIALAESGPVPAPGMVVQGLKWMLDPDSPLYVRPSFAPGFVRFMFAMARHCNRDDYRRALATHLQLAATCIETFDEWSSEGITYEEHRRGVLLAYEHDESFADRRSHDDVFERFGYRCEALDQAAAHEREPSLSSAIRHALYYRDDRQIEPGTIMASLASSLADGGHRILSDEGVTSFTVSGERVRSVETTTSSHPCDVAVIAAGAFSGQLTQRLRSPIPIRPGKGYCVDYPVPPSQVTTPLTFEDAHVAVSPLDGKLRIAGTMEFAGLDIKIRQRRVEAMKAGAAAGFGDWDPTVAHLAPQAGLRPMTPDGLPVIGHVPGYSNTLIASGHGMLGLTLAPSTAKVIRRLSAGEALPRDLAALRPERFSSSRRRR